MDLTLIETYGNGNSWQVLAEGVPPSSTNNPGIGNLTVTNKQLDISRNCVITLSIDAELVNKVPFASDKASLLFGVNGSNLHINIHKSGSMDVAGTFGNKTVKFDCKLGHTGEINYIVCS